MKLTKHDGATPEVVPLFPGEHIPSTTWQAYVYGGKERPRPSTTVSQRTWKRLLSYHKYKCVRCRRHFPYGRGLSPHHIIPRAKGGNDDIANLIPLCIDQGGNKCHDYVDMVSFQSIIDIRLSFPTPEEDLCGDELL